MKFLGKYSANGDIELPILAEDTGLYFFVEIGQNDAEVRKINLEVIEGQSIKIPNQFKENDFISFKIKKRNRRLIYHEEESVFSLLIDREDFFVQDGNPTTLLKKTKEFSGAYAVTINFELGKTIFYNIGDLRAYTRSIDLQDTYLKFTFDFPSTGRVNYFLI